VAKLTLMLCNLNVEDLKNRTLLASTREHPRCVSDRDETGERVSFINENTPRAPTGTKNTLKPARLAILR